MLNGISRIAASASSAAAGVSAAAISGGSRAEARLRKPAPEVVIEEYDLCETTGRNAVPTLEEVEAASKELQKSFADKNTCHSEAAAAADEVVITEVRKENRTGQLVGGCSTANHHRGPAAVSQCMNLFQRDPDVQAAVMSLARDPALWDAFVRNEKVQQLLRDRRRSPLPGGGNLELLQHQMNPFLVAAHCLKNTVWGALDSIVDVVHGVFGFMDRALFGGRQSEPVDRPLKACMVLTILLFSLVLLNRGSRL